MDNYPAIINSPLSSLIITLLNCQLSILNCQFYLIPFRFSSASIVGSCPRNRL